MEYVESYNIENYTLKEYNIIDKYGIERPNIVFKIDFGRDKTLHIISHLDTVPEGILVYGAQILMSQLLKMEKFMEGEVRTTIRIVSSLLLLKMIFENNIEPKYNLSLIFVSDEEDGSEYGLKYLLNNFEDEIFKRMI